MKYFIFSLLLSAGVVMGANAQGFNFVVEEDEGEVQTQQENQSIEVQDSDDVANETVVSENVQPSEEQPEQVMDSFSSESEQEESEDDEDQLIYMALNNVKSNLASIRAVSYCSGVFILFNATKKEVQEMSGTIGIGDQIKEFKFTNVASKDSIGLPIQMVGKACESIMNVPDVQIKTCKVKGMSNRKCRSKLRYVPLGAG